MTRRAVATYLLGPAGLTPPSAIVMRAVLPVAVPVAFLSAACRGAATEPFHHVTDAAPSGVAVVATAGPTQPNAQPLEASVLAVGDSVVLTYVFGGSACGLDFVASAGTVAGTLVVTHVGRFPDTLRACTAEAPRFGPTFRLALRPPAGGRVVVAFRQRVQRRAGAPEFLERELVRRDVVLP